MSYQTTYTPQPAAASYNAAATLSAGVKAGAAVALAAALFVLLVAGGRK